MSMHLLFRSERELLIFLTRSMCAIKSGLVIYGKIKDIGQEQVVEMGALRACPQNFFCLIPSHVFSESTIKRPVNEGATQPEHAIAI